MPDPASAAASPPEEPDTEPAPPVTRVSIFVDGSNFTPSKLGAGITHKIDYQKFGAVLCEQFPGGTLVYLHYVAGAFRHPERQRHQLNAGEYAERLGRYNETKRLLDRLEATPNIKVHRGVMLYRTPDAKDPRSIVEKESDVELALTMVDEARADAYDIAILVASDADFAPAVRRVRALGKRVVWAHFGPHTHIKALTRAGAEPLLLTDTMLAPCADFSHLSSAPASP